MTSGFTYTLEPFTVSFRASEPTLPWLDETHRAARLVAESTDKPLYLCMSGGIDSEVMAEAFLAEKIPFTALTLEYPFDLNQHDIVFAKSWCRQRQVPHKILPFDLVKMMVEAKLADEGYVTGNIFRYLQVALLEVVESLGGAAVLGAGELLYQAPLDKAALTIDDVTIELDTGMTVAAEWCKRNNLLHHTPFFFYSTPELPRAWMRLPHVKFSLEHPEIYKHRTNRNGYKIIMYRSMFPQQAPRNKFNGFENVKSLRQVVERHLRVRFGSAIQVYRSKVVDLFGYP